MPRQVKQSSNPDPKPDAEVTETEEDKEWSSWWCDHAITDEEKEYFGCPEDSKHIYCQWAETQSEWEHYQCWKN